MFAVNWPPQAPALGQATFSKCAQFLVGILARLVAAHGLEHVLNRHVLSIEPARHDRPAVDEHGRHVQTHHGHHHPRQRLVAARKPDDGVIAMAAHGQFHGVGNRLARGERRAHPFMPHGDPVGHGDGGEFARCAEAFLHTQFHRLSLPVQRDVARRGLVPAGRDANEGLRDLFLGDPHGIVIRPMRRTRRTFGYMTTGKIGFVELLFQHGWPPGLADLGIDPTGTIGKERLSLFRPIDCPAFKRHAKASR